MVDVKRHHCYVFKCATSLTNAAMCDAIYCHVVAPYRLHVYVALNILQVFSKFYLDNNGNFHCTPP